MRRKRGWSDPWGNQRGGYAIEQGHPLHEKQKRDPGIGLEIEVPRAAMPPPTLPYHRSDGINE